jgi:hypothetical protein
LECKKKVITIYAVQLQKITDNKLKKLAKDKVKLMGIF